MNFVCSTMFKQTNKKLQTNKQRIRKKKIKSKLDAYQQIW